ncbi:hypothetical protein LJC58_03030 [Lachnospiraceae bacterium OttesenSCG-928-D06]|nr:hypothetical protein [Lachnospiraceae bacterium OttesenSCG-928-D06]
MTLEAAVVMPLLLFFFLNIMSSIEMIRLHGNLQLALWEAGNKMAVYAHAYDTLIEDDVSESFGFENFLGIATSYLYVRDEIIDYCGKDYLEQSPLRKGVESLHFWESEIMDKNDCINLIVTYQVAPPFSILGDAAFRMANQYYGRGFTGYDVIDALEDEGNMNYDYVYITETGSVYHETKDCSHLKIAVRAVRQGEALVMQNEDNKSYTLCLLCGKQPQVEEVYLTAAGERYHYISSCPGLKRTIFTILRTEADEYRPCSRCAA